MAKQHQMEKENQETYTAQALRDLKHKHAAATKQLPKNLKVGHISLHDLYAVFYFICKSIIVP